MNRRNENKDKYRNTKKNQDETESLETNEEAKPQTPVYKNNESATKSEKPGDEMAGPSKNKENEITMEDQVVQKQQQRLDATMLASPSAELLANTLVKTEVVLAKSLETAVRAGVLAMYDGPNWKLGGGYGVFKLIDSKKAGNIPTFVTWRVSQSDQNTVLKDIDDLRSLENSNPLIKKSAMLLPENLLTLRFDFNTNPLGEPIGGPNDVDDYHNVIQVISVKNAQGNQQQIINLIVTRIINLLVAYNRTSKYILGTPSKTVFSQAEIPPEFQSLVRLKTTVDDNGHVYWLGITSLIPWLRQEIAETVLQAEPVFGEVEVTTSPNKVKTGALWGLSTDQWMAAILNSNANEVHDKRMNTQELYNHLLSINMNTIQHLEMKNPPDLYYPLITGPSEQEVNSYWFMMMVSKSAKMTAINALVETLRKSNRFTLNSPEEALNFTDTPRRTVDSTVFQMLKTLMSVGRMSDHLLLLVLEVMGNNCCYTLQDVPMTGMAGNIATIMMLLMWPLTFPRLAQNLRMELGLRLMMAIRNLIGAGPFQAFTSVYGWTRRRVNNQWVIENNTVPRSLSSYDLPDSIQPSIFTIDVQPPRNQELTRFMWDVSQFCNVDLHLTPLLHAENAPNFPKSTEDSQFFLPYPVQPLNRQDFGDETNMSNKIRDLINILTSAESLYLNQQAQRVETGNRDWLHNLITLIENKATTAPSLYNGTLADLCLWMAETPLIVNDGAVNANVYPPRYGLGGDFDEIGRERRNRRPIQIHGPSFNLDVALPMRIFFTGVGDRNIPTDFRQIVSINNANSPVTKEEIMPPDPVEIFSVYNTLLNQSSKLASVLQVLRWIDDPAADNNPFPVYTATLRRAAIMRQWTLLMNEVSKSLDAESINDVLDLVTSFGVKDARYVIPRVVIIDQEMAGTEAAIQPENSRIGRQLDITDQYFLEKMNILSPLFIGDTSVFTNQTTGVYFGKINLRNRQLTVTRDVILEQYPNVIEFTDLNYNYVEGEDGKSLQVDFPEIGVIEDFGDARLVGTLLELDRFSIIPVNMVSWLVSAILDHKIMLFVREKTVRYTIQDLSNRLVSYNESITAQQLQSIFLDQDDKDFVHTFYTTEYANNLIRNEIPIPGYIQYITLAGLRSSNLMSASITNTALPRGNHVRLDPRNWGLGTRQGPTGSLLPVSNVPKLGAGVLNFNNLVRTISPGVLELQPEFIRVPLNPVDIKL